MIMIPVQGPLAGHARLDVLQLDVVQVVDRLDGLHQPVVGDVVLVVSKEKLIKPKNGNGKKKIENAGEKAQ